MPTLLPSPVEIAVSEFVPSRSGLGVWGEPTPIASSALLPDVGEYLTTGNNQLLRITSLRVDITHGGQRVVLYGAKVNQPNLP